MSLSDRLRRVSPLGQPPESGGSVTTQGESQRPLDEMVGGEWVSSSGVRCLRAEQCFPVTHMHGSRPIGHLLEIPSQRWQPFVNDGPGIELTHALFIDTETTGLGRDASTYAFLVGVGFFREDGFCVRQYFMPDYAQENALLDLLADDLLTHDGLVSFNGRSFDWPLIETRYVLARREPPGDGSRHLDLLHLSRSLWRNMLSSCALSSLEQNVLGIVREAADVPGWLIPGIYRDYVETGAAEPVSRVFYHNAIDILSLVALAAEIGEHIDEPFRSPDAPNRDYVALGRLFERTGRLDEALGAYATAAATGNALERRAADRYRSMLLKRMGRLDEAADLWRSKLESSEAYAYVELAKYLEHRLKDYAGAAGVVSRAIDGVVSGRIDYHGATEPSLLDELEHRLARVQRRASTRCANDES